jgi:hypothetical protein
MPAKRGVMGSKVSGHVGVDLLASDQVEVYVDPVLLVPELAFYGPGGLLCPFLEGCRVFPEDARHLREVAVGLAEKRVE